MFGWLHHQHEIFVLPMRLSTIKRGKKQHFRKRRGVEVMTARTGISVAEKAKHITNDCVLVHLHEKGLYVN